METFKKRRTYYEDDNMEISLMEMSGHLFAHIVFFNLKKSSIIKAREVWDEIKEKCYRLGYDQINAYTKDTRIIELFDGWEHLGSFEHETEGKYEVARWVLTL